MSGDCFKLSNFSKTYVLLLISIALRIWALQLAAGLHFCWPETFMQLLIFMSRCFWFCFCSLKIVTSSCRSLGSMLALLSLWVTQKTNFSSLCSNGPIFLSLRLSALRSYILIIMAPELCYKEDQFIKSVLIYCVLLLDLQVLWLYFLVIRAIFLALAKLCYYCLFITVECFIELNNGWRITIYGDYEYLSSVYFIFSLLLLSISVDFQQRLIIESMIQIFS